MRKLFLLTFVLLGCLISNAQSIVESVVPEFKGIDVNGKMSVKLVKAEEGSFRAEVKNTTTDKLEWEIKNGILSIKLKQGLSVGGDKPKPEADVVIYYTKLESVKANSVTLLNEGVIEGNMFAIEAVSSANVSLNIEVKDVKVDVSGSKLTLGGKVEFCTIKAGGSAYVNSVPMECDNMNALAVTNAECYVAATKRLEAKANSNATIFYCEKPGIFQESTATFGKVQQVQSVKADIKSK